MFSLGSYNVLLGLTYFFIVIIIIIIIIIITIIIRIIILFIFCQFRLVFPRTYIVTPISTLNKFHKQTNNLKI